MSDFGKKEAIIKNLEKYKISFETFSNDYFYCGNNINGGKYFF